MIEILCRNPGTNAVGWRNMETVGPLQRMKRVGTNVGWNGDNRESSDPMLILTLNDNSIVNCYTRLDVSIMSMPGIVHDLMLELTNGTRFNRNQVRRVDFGPGWNLNYIPNYFLSGLGQLIHLGSLPTIITSIGNHFLQFCTSFNQPIILSNNINSIGMAFLMNCTSYDQPINIPNSLSIIDSAFMAFCTSFNSPVTIFSTPSFITNSFMFSCTSFNQPVTMPNTITRIGDNFLGNCSSFNSSLQLSNTIASIGHGFLERCTSFNQPLLIRNGIVDIGNSFMNGCWSFNQPINIPNTISRIESMYLAHCRVFNQPINIPSSVTNIGNGFMFGSRMFNRNMVIPNSVVEIGNEFMMECNAFTGSITIPSSVTSIGPGFMIKHNVFSSFTINASPNFITALMNDDITHLHGWRISLSGQWNVILNGPIGNPGQIYHVNISGLTQAQFDQLRTRFPDINGARLDPGGDINVHQLGFRHLRRV